MNLKRKVIDCNKQKERENIFDKFKHLVPCPPSQKIRDPLEKGNTKTGCSGSCFEIIFVWNLPPCVTCPGASLWCETHCYNLDLRSDIYNIDLWCENWWKAIYELEKLESDIINQLTEYNDKSIAVRFHSSGDFFSMDYINMWINICKRLKHIHFWGYTRSWAVPELSELIIELSSLENVNLYASVDTSMDQIPNCKMSITVDTDSELSLYLNNDNFIVCPEQLNLVLNCANCAQCIKKSNKSIVFIAH